MRRIFLQLLLVSTAIFGGTASAQWDPNILESERPYVESLITVVGRATSFQSMVEVCAKRFPTSADAAQSALRAFRVEHGKLLSDLERRMRALWKGGGFEPAEIEENFVEMKRSSFEHVEAKISSLPIEKRIEFCKQVPTQIQPNRLGFESKLAAELKIIRAHPVEVARRKAP